MQMQAGARTADIDIDVDRDEGPPSTRHAPKSRPGDSKNKQWYIRPAGAVHPQDGDALIGEMTCEWQNMGVRVNVRQWPIDVRVFVFPINSLDMGSYRWCPAINSCSAGFDAHAVIEEDIINITARKGGNNNLTNCGWPDFSLIGTFYDGKDGLAGSGSLFSPNFKTLEPKFAAHHSDNYAERWSKHCKQINEDILGHWGGGGVTCHKFELHKCEGRQVEKGERLIYFMRSFAGDGPNDLDPALKPKDRKLALSQKDNPIFHKAFGDEPQARAQRIYVAPTTRAIESAALAFGTEGVPITIDPRLKDKQNKLFKSNAKAQLINLTDHGFIYPEIASKVMDGYEKMEMKAKGRDMDRDMLGDENERMDNFFHDILQRPEKRIIVVGHMNLIRHGFGFIDFPGGAEVRILMKNGVVSQVKEDPYCFGAL